MSTKYNVGWLKDEQNQIFIPFTYAKSVKLDDSNKTLDITVSTVDEHTNALKGQGDRIAALEEGDKPAGSAAQTVGKLTIGNSSFNGSKDVLVTAKDLGITGALVYRGVSSTEITNGGTELPKIGKDYIALSDLNPGNIVLYKTEGGVIYQEFVWTGEAWELLGDEGSYALKTIEIVARDGLINAGSGNTSLRDNIIISVNPGEGLTITSTDKKLALKPIDPSVVNEDIAIDTNGITSFILPSVTVDTYGRVTSITNKTIQLNDVADKVNNLINNVSGLTSQLKSVIDDIAGDNTQNDKIVPRINTLETRTKYLYAADDKDTAFAIADGKGGVVFEVQPDGTTRGIDFKTKLGYTINNNAQNIADNASGIAINTSSIGSIKTTLNSHNSRIIANASAITAHSTTLTSHASLLTSHTTKLSSHASILTNYGNSISANATAIGTKANSTITITGDGTTTDGGGNLQSNRVISLKSIYSSAQSWGPSIASFPAFGTSFTVPQITVDQYGRVTKAFNRAITLPSTSDLENGIAANVTAIGSINTTLNSQATVLSNHTSLLSSHTSTLSSHASILSSHTSTLSSYATKLTNYRNSISANATAIKTINNSISGINSSISSINTKITSINSSISTMQGSITSNTSALTTKVNINDYNNKISELTTSIKNNTDQLAINATRFDSNDNELITIRTNDNLQNEAINTMLERIGDTEMRTQYIHPNPSPLNSNAFAICDGDGDIALEVQTDGKTRGFDFITVDGNSVNENEARIEALEGKLQNITVQSASGNATAFIDSISQNNEGIIIATKKNIPVFNGATNQNNGTSGLVTQPLIADRTKFLCGDGTWKTVSTDDKKVNQTSSSTNKNYPLLISTNENPNGQDLSAYYNSGVTMNPSTKEIIANNFKGGLNTNGKNIQLTENVNYGTSITSANDGILVFEEISGSLIPEDGTHGYVLTSNQGKPNWQENIAAGIQINPIENNRIYVTGTFDAQYLYYNNNVYIEDNVLMGAAWNDYAEYRICKDNYKAGQVVCENGDDTLSISKERLQPGAELVSDTFGFAIGQTAEATCPIAVSGRVLAYTYEPREEFKAGDAVCAGPNGTVSKMTREEIREYPERIIGTVSAIPNYETWNDKVIVNNRIWIKIK